MKVTDSNKKIVQIIAVMLTVTFIVFAILMVVTWMDADSHIHKELAFSHYKCTVDQHEGRPNSQACQDYERLNAAHNK